MNRTKLRLIENMIIFTFPVVLFAGCAGSDVKPTMEDNSVATYSDYNNPLPETALIDISTSYAADESAELSVTEDTSSTELSKENQTSHDETGIVSRNSSPYTPDSEITLSQKQNSQSIMHTTNSMPELPGNNLFKFDTDKYQLLDDQQMTLKQHAEYLKANPDITLVINGHADIRGAEDYNQALSEKRAKAVFDLLVNLGVSQSQLKTFSFGEKTPLRDEDNWDENRRVELEYNNPVVLSSMQ
jgi:peptidoglycan-associated lipoprotein